MEPRCPICNSPMVKRVARRGTYAGNEFWGCSRYPECRGIVNIDDEIQKENKHLESPLQEIVENENITIDYEARPYEGFVSMQSYETFGCDKQFLYAINNGLIDEKIAGQFSKFRVDYAASKKSPLTEPQRQICSIALRMLCRGKITLNSPATKKFVETLTEEKHVYSEGDLYAFPCMVNHNVNYSFDSERECLFAENIIGNVIGSNWNYYTDTQVSIDSLCQRNDEKNLLGQRVDFLINIGEESYVIELDGNEHRLHQEKDEERDKLLKNNGYEVLRIDNDTFDSEPERLMEQMEGIFSAPEHQDITQETCALYINKLIHQIQISLVSAVARHTMSTDEVIDIYIEPNPEIKNYIEGIFEFSIKDLKELIDHLCVLYGEDEFFNITFGRETSAYVCVGSVPHDFVSGVLISDLCIDKHINCEIPVCSDLQIKNVDETGMLYFMHYLFRHEKADGAPAGFREGQYEGIYRLLNGLDSIILLPTGSGKSLIYQLAAMIAPGKTIVVSPLVSLMQDQLDNLKGFGIDCAVYVSSVNTDSINELMNPSNVLIYISPERLQIQSFRDAISAMQINNRVFAIAVDEAHCVSEWGHDFRTAYLNIGRTSRNVFTFNGQKPTIIALTGTASTAVLKDVKRELEIPSYEAIITPETFDRPELKFKVVNSNSDKKQEHLLEIFNRTIPDYFNKNRDEFFRLNLDKTNSGIVFCPHVNGDFGIVNVSDALSSQMHVNSGLYSGSKPKKVYADWEKLKRETALDFKNNRINTLVATKAFGMGIDKPNVKFTVHYGIPSSIESFYQEAGRAGRDCNMDGSTRDKDALCILMLSNENKYEDDNVLLNPETELEKICETIEEKGYGENDDISRMMYFHINSFKGIEFERENVNEIIETIFEGDSLSIKSKLIKCGNDSADNSLGNMQKALQRLFILGVVSDYTVNYSASEITVKLGSIDESEISKRYALYVKGYNEGRVHGEKEKLKIDGDYSAKEYVVNAVKVLTEFVYDTIEKGRRRGLREMKSAAEKALESNNPDRELRQRIVFYFETTYSEKLNEIIDGKSVGFDIIQEIIDGENRDGELAGGIRSSREAAGLRGGVSRYLESTPDHPGLLGLRALAELYCSNSDTDSICRDINAACRNAIELYSVDRNKLQNFAKYFMRKILERNDTLYKQMVEIVSEYVDMQQLCSELIDSDYLNEKQKTAPAEVYFGMMAKNTLTKIRSLKGEE